MDTLFFIRKLIQGTLLNPLFFLSVVLAVGVVRAFLSDRRPSKLTLLAALALVAPLGLPIAHWLTLPLEKRFPKPPMAELQDATAVVVLGGTVSPRRSLLWSEVVLHDGAERLTTGARLARELPEVSLVFSSFEGEAIWARRFWIEQGIDKSRIRLDGTANTTSSNAHGVLELLGTTEDPIVLVTSAKHIPRAVGAFLAVGFENVIPYPTDYRSPYRSHTSLHGNWALITESFHEWLGMLVYWLNDDSHLLYPSPKDLVMTGTEAT